MEMWLGLLLLIAVLHPFIEPRLSAWQQKRYAKKWRENQ